MPTTGRPKAIAAKKKSVRVGILLTPGEAHDLDALVVLRQRFVAEEERRKPVYATQDAGAHEPVEHDSLSALDDVAAHHRGGRLMGFAAPE
jgi:hypothetical protein